jgi:hypothetical protein
MVLQESRTYWNGGVFAVWPVNGFRKGSGVPTISAATGMIGYPIYTQNGMIVKSMFSPAVTFGALVTVKSTLKLPLTPNGQWQVQGLTYNLDSLVPRGEWSMILALVPPGFVGTSPL